MPLKNHYLTCSKCDFKQLLRKSSPNTGPYFVYLGANSNIWYPIPTTYAWCANCKLVRDVETLDTSLIHAGLNQLLLEEEAFRLRHSGALARVRTKLGLFAEANYRQREIANAKRLIDLLGSRTRSKCLWCESPVLLAKNDVEHGSTLESEDLTISIPHPSCSGGILTEVAEETRLHLDFDLEGVGVRCYSIEGNFLRETRAGKWWDSGGKWFRQ